MADKQVISVMVNNGSAASSATNQQVRSGRQLVTITLLSCSGYCPPAHVAVPQSTTSLRHSQNLASLTLVLTTTQASIGVRSQGQKRSESHSKLDKVLLKAACKAGKQKDSKTFTLRNVDVAAVLLSQDLKKLIKESLHDDICSRDFDIGYMQGSNVIRVCTKEDMLEMWSEVKKQGMLWCDGLVDTGSKANKSGRKGRGKYVSDEDSDDEPSMTPPKKKKKKVDRDNEAKAQEIFDDLKSKHGTQYTVMQLRIWAELIAGGLYSSTCDPPSENSMFQRAGGGLSGQKKKDTMGTTIAQPLATAFTSALDPAKGHGVPINNSPAKLIESRSKLYKQLSELQNLRSMGILTDAEYATEKETIMNLLKELKSH